MREKTLQAKMTDMIVGVSVKMGDKVYLCVSVSLWVEKDERRMILRVAGPGGGEKRLKKEHY